MKKLNPFAHFFLLLVILIPYSLMLLNFDTKVAESATNEQILVDKDALKVTSSYQIDTLKMTIDWSLTYESQAETGTNQLLKMNFDNESQSFEDHTSNWQQEDTGWWSQEQFSEASQGVIRFSTPLSESCVFISLQLDQKQVAEDGEEVIEEAVLTATEEGPHELIAEVPTKASSSQTSSSSSKESHEESSESESNQVATSSTSNPSSSSSAEETGQSTESFIGPVRSQRVQVVPQARGTSSTDPFLYTPMGDGKHPTHGTHTFLGGGAKEDLFIKNYHYGVQVSPEDVPQYLVTNSGFSEIDRGYHEYGTTTTGQINTKKTVKYLENKADGTKVFEVTVDTIGDAKQPQPPVDIVLVLDKSGSMRDATTSGSTRWLDLQRAVGRFLDSIAQSNMNVRFALVSFFSSSIRSVIEGTHDGHMAVWTNQKSSTPDGYSYDDYFTNDYSKLKASEILVNNAYSNTGTPTFMGIESALHVLSKVERESTKVICTISDGLPTVYPIPTYYQGLSLNQSLKKLYFSQNGTSNIPDNRFLTQGGLNGYTLQANGDGINKGVGNSNTMPYLTKRLEEFGTAYKWYSVGYHTGTETYNSIIETLGKDGVFSVNDTDGLVDALSQSIYPYISTIGNGTITDPMSKFVILDQSSVTITPIHINQNGTLSDNPGGNGMGIKKSVSADSIKLENVNLGKTGGNRNGVRLTYKVTLKPEYRNGNFYPANESTYLLNGDGQEYFYVVPSIRDGELPADTVDVELTKVIKGTTEGLVGAQFGLFTTKTGGSARYESNLTTKDGKLKFSKVEPGVYWLREITTPQGYRSFSPVQVTIDGQGTVTGLSTFPNIENEWKPIQLEILKQGETKEVPLGGAEFGLYDVDPDEEQASPIAQGTSAEETGMLFFDKLLSPGQTYYLKELKAPAGYLKQKGSYRIQVAVNGELTITYQNEEISSADMEYLITTDGESHQLKLVVKNTPITPLPRTGGAGRMGSYLLLVVLLAGLSLYYVSSRRDSGQKGGV